MTSVCVCSCDFTSFEGVGGVQKMELASTAAAYVVSWILRSCRSTGTFLPRNVLRWELLSFFSSAAVWEVKTPENA